MITLAARLRDLGGGFLVRRVLPSAQRRLVGPFIFVDQMGPVTMPLGEGLDVRPHPHINLATVTYLLDGEIVHKDSLGSDQRITPGAVNWMTAGRGIVHSERSPAEVRKAGARAYGLQTWVALPKEHEEIAPAFQHVRAADIPEVDIGSVRLRVLAGSAYGEASPAKTLSPLFYVHARFEVGASLALPDYAERAVYVLEGELTAHGTNASPGEMLVFDKGDDAILRASAPTTAILLGGATLDGERHIWWNFVSSSAERIERAKADWRERRMGVIPGDNRDFIPLPDA
jgi:redox-sensitive bicupin YhaK (pirin superfamily)